MATSLRNDKRDQNDATEPPPRHPEPPSEANTRGGSLEPRSWSELVDRTSDASFPASDAPAWTPIASP